MRLIDADALMPNAELKGVNCIVTAYDIAKAPTIDAVQVVRCKDCKYSYTMITAKAKDGQERWTRFCDKHKTLFPKDDWFCKDGERKEE